MSKKLFSALMALVMMMSMTVFASADEPMLISAQDSSDGQIVILHTNDVHCGYLAYDKVATLAKGADLLVDAGDAIQGDVIGTLSTGEYIVDIMNYLGYDLAIPGNHEFDYGMDRFLELAQEKAEYPYISANFKSLSTGKSYFDAYKVFEVEGKKVAFVGISTPETFTKSTPTYFQDEKGNYIYSFCEGNNGQDLYDAVQAAIDAAEAEGADYIIGLAHLGIDDESKPWTSKEVIANTTGLDILIDGHSHSTVSETVGDKNSNAVILQQTGTKLANVGKITIKADGTVVCENVDLANVEADPEATAYLAGITEKFDALQSQIVAKSDVDLTIFGADGKRAVRNSETNLGDLCADAYRAMLGADIAFVNGGGVRANIAAGDITYGDIIKVHPFGNEACLVEVTGQQIKDALELGASACPGENGGFLQVSGLTYTINATIPSSVVKDDKDMFVKVDGAYRVSDIMVDGKPLDVNKTYTLASHNYMLKSQGDGYAMFGTDNVKIIKDCVMIDNQVLINYIVDKLGGVVGQEYAAPAGRITVKKPTFEDVTASHWAISYVEYVAEKGLFNGTSTTTFTPDANTTRAQLMTVLARHAGADTTGDALAKGMAWAVEKGISDGTNGTGSITREQLATMLYRYAGSPAATADLSSYTDAGSVSVWAKDAMNWAVEKGIITGMTENTLVPGGYATRAQVATMMQRFCTL
ncbi:MAG: 5'-nucleotidase C-terminal domain-containing protein [Oscillospiraceae bacterium]|nr:5'-nucleotidase C-terminal domain-containing protein [Oscillospiraceae bacterium]